MSLEPIGALKVARAAWMVAHHIMSHWFDDNAPEHPARKRLGDIEEVLSDLERAVRGASTRRVVSR